MGEFFKGWRRKAGLVTLVMALASFSLWMRSFAVFDQIAFAHGGRQHSALVAGGRIYWQATILTDETVMTEGSEVRFESFDGSLAEVMRSVEWTRDELKQNPKLKFREWIILYWSLVLPLTLLSAWLILGKPRKAQPAANSRLAAHDESSQ